MAQVFLSYQKRDRDLVQRIDKALTRRGLTVWWDDHAGPEESWGRILNREIRKAKIVLVLWTANSVDSEWVTEEADYAKECSPSKLVQARFDGCEIPLGFRRRLYVDLDRERPEQSEQWPKLMRWLGIDQAAPDSPPPQPVADSAGTIGAPMVPGPGSPIPRPPDRDPGGAPKSGVGPADILSAMGILAGAAIPLALLFAAFNGNSPLPDFYWVTWIALGLVAGVIAKVIIPGRDPAGCLVTILLGAAGALLAGFLGRQLGWYEVGEGAGFLAAIVGAVIILFVYRLFARR